MIDSFLNAMKAHVKRAVTRLNYGAMGTCTLVEHCSSMCNNCCLKVFTQVARRSVLFFRLWVYVGFILIVSASLLALILPVWEARALCWVITKRLFRWDSPKTGLNYDGSEYSHNGNVVVGDAMWTLQLARALAPQLALLMLLKP